MSIKIINIKPKNNIIIINRTCDSILKQSQYHFFLMNKLDL